MFCARKLLNAASVSPIKVALSQSTQLVNGIKVELEINGSKGVFSNKENNVVVAEMIFSKTGRITTNYCHIQVSDAPRGIVACKKLVAESVNYDRKNNFKILPLCSFGKAVFNKTPEYAGVLQV